MDIASEWTVTLVGYSSLALSRAEALDDHVKVSRRGDTSKEPSLLSRKIGRSLVRISIVPCYDTDR